MDDLKYWVIVKCSEVVRVVARVYLWNLEGWVIALHNLGSITIVLNKLWNSGVLDAVLEFVYDLHVDGLFFKVGVAQPISDGRQFV